MRPTEPRSLDSSTHADFPLLIAVGRHQITSGLADNTSRTHVSFAES